MLTSPGRERLWPDKAAMFLLRVAELGFHCPDSTGAAGANVSKQCPPPTLLGSALRTDGGALLLKLKRQWGSTVVAMTAREDVEVIIHTALGRDDHALVNRILRMMTPEAALLWLQGSEPFLGGARPADVLAIDGAGPLLDALGAIEQGGFA